MISLITFDGLAIPVGDFGEDLDNIENISKSEAGTDLGNLIRAEKLTLACTTKCNGHFKKKLQEKGKLPLALATYEGRTFEARLRIKSAKHVEDSETIEGAASLWNVSYSIIEV